jgi:hypothetical protein
MIRILFILCTLSLCSATLLLPPIKLSWKTMQNIQFKKQYYKEIDGEMMTPVFTPELIQLNGQHVQVEGYCVPVDEKGRYIALSANPYASCFFCGKAGPASVMTIKFKKKNKSYNTDDYKHFTGRLRLNYDDINEFYYVLEDAVEIPQ